MQREIVAFLGAAQDSFPRRTDNLDAKVIELE